MRKRATLLPAPLCFTVVPCDTQGVASRFDSLQLLPPPPSYSLLVSRFLLLWSATLPFPLLSVLPRW